MTRYLPGYNCSGVGSWAWSGENSTAGRITAHSHPHVMTHVWVTERDGKITAASLEYQQRKKTSGQLIASCRESTRFWFISLWLGPFPPWGLTHHLVRRLQSYKRHTSGKWSRPNPAGTQSCKLYPEKKARYLEKRIITGTFLRDRAVNMSAWKSRSRDGKVLPVHFRLLLYYIAEGTLVHFARLCLHGSHSYWSLSRSHTKYLMMIWNIWATYTRMCL